MSSIFNDKTTSENASRMNASDLHRMAMDAEYMPRATNSSTPLVRSSQTSGNGLNSLAAPFVSANWSGVGTLRSDVAATQPVQPTFGSMSFSASSARNTFKGRDEQYPHFNESTENDIVLTNEPSVSDRAIISSLKEQIDVLITAIMIQDTQAKAITKGVDAAEISHRVMTRIEKLRQENERLAELLNGKRSMLLETENARLRRENEDLRAQLTQARAVGFKMN